MGILEELRKELGVKEEVSDEDLHRLIGQVGASLWEEKEGSDVRRVGGTLIYKASGGWKSRIKTGGIATVTEVVTHVGLNESLRQRRRQRVKSSKG